MGHDHDHDRRRLTIALGLTGGYCVVEFAGGWFTNSLALLSDAGHMLSDVTAMGLSLFAAYVATLLVTSQKTFGYYCAEILAAFLNGLALWLVAVWSFARPTTGSSLPRQSRDTA